MVLKADYKDTQDIFLPAMIPSYVCIVPSCVAQIILACTAICIVISV